MRTLGQGRRIGEPALAAERPLRLGCDHRAIDRHAVDPGDPPAQARYARDMAHARRRRDEAVEFGDLARLDIDEEEGGRLLRKPLADRVLEIALDERDG